MESHILAQLTFGPWHEDAAEEWKEKVEEAFESFLYILPKCSQIIGEAVHGVSDGKLQAYVRLPRLDALDAHHLSRYERSRLTVLETLLGCPMEIRILSHGDGVLDQVDWRQAEWLVLYGAGTDGMAPVRDLNKRCIPSYLLPIDADNMERLCFWARDEERHCRIWFSSRSLEKETFVALADPKSDLNTWARELALMVEKATGKPTYTHLFRHYALPDDDELTRPCPLCGGDWKVGGEAFEFRCEPCRLTSYAGCDTGGKNAEEFARIGTWPGRKGQ